MSFKIYKTNPVSKVDNSGTGTKLAKKQGDELIMKTLKAGPNIMLSDDSNAITITSTGGGGGGIIGTITTFSFFPTTLVSIPTSINTSYVVDTFVVCSNTTTQHTNVFFIKAGYRNIGGVLTLVSGIQDKLSEIQDVGVDAKMLTSGTDIILQVQGITANTINWTGEVRIQNSSF